MPLRSTILLSEAEKAEPHSNSLPQAPCTAHALRTALRHESGNSEGSVLDCVTAEEQTGIVYATVHACPDFYQKTIRGRGTTCWKVQNDNSDISIVKDSRKNQGRVYASMFLRRVEDIDGVGHTRRSQDQLAPLSQLRLIHIARSLDGFKSRGELLGAYHDALCGAYWSPCSTFSQCCSFITLQDIIIFARQESFTATSALTTFSLANMVHHRKIVA